MYDKYAERQDHNLSRYVWGEKKVNDIRKLTLSWGDLPIYNIDVEDNIVRLYRRINGSRDGRIRFPDGYFDEKKKYINNAEKEKLFHILGKIDFNKWKTDDTTIFNIEIRSAGFCVNESIQCYFVDGSTFYCAQPPRKPFRKVVKYLKKLFPEESMKPFYPKDM